MFKELFINEDEISIINEGTTATITVKDGDLYRTSILQYDGYDSFMKPELKTHWQGQQKAMELVTNSGELRGVHDGDAEYYKDRNLLMMTKDKRQAVENANECHFKYYFNGTQWFWANKGIRTFSQMKKI